MALQRLARSKIVGVALASNPTSAWSNEVRFSFNSFNEAIAPVDHTVNPTQYGLTTGVTDPRLFGFPRVTVGRRSTTWAEIRAGRSIRLRPQPIVSLTLRRIHVARHTIRLEEISDSEMWIISAQATDADASIFGNSINFSAGDVRRWRLICTETLPRSG